MWTTEDSQAMDMAADQAAQELQALVDNNPTAREGVEKVIAWWNHNYMKAGHKRLGRALLHLRVPAHTNK
jgi:hypothetical protein